MAKRAKRTAIRLNGESVDQASLGAALPQKTPAPPEPESILDHPETILVVQDADRQAISLIPALQDLEYKILGPAISAQQAIQMTRQIVPDLALLDTSMPEAQALDLVNHLFGDRGIPVVISSAFRARASLKTTSKLGIFGYLVEPVTSEDLQIHLAIAWARFRQTCKLRQELRETRTTLDNRIIIEKAKGLLMTSLGLTEAEAMRRLQELASETHRKMVAVAQAIIEANEVLRPR